MKKIRVLSDLHLDVNESYDFKIPKNGQNIFTVIAGDISGDPETTTAWLKKNIKRGIFVSGNHDVYNRSGLSLEELKTKLANEFKLVDAVTYLDTSVNVVMKEVDGILFLGSCLYSDMRYPSSVNPKGEVEFNCRKSEWYLNDFRFGKVKDEDGKNRRLQAKDYIKWFGKTVAEFDWMLTENEKSENPKPVVVVTHFAPHANCVGSYYVSSDCNCAYVSDMTDFIERHPSIKVWVYGHIHEQKRFDFKRKDGSVCKFVNNARAYLHRYEDEGFNPNTFINTETWEIETVSPSKSQLDKLAKRKAEHDRRLRSMLAYGFF